MAAKPNEDSSIDTSKQTYTYNKMNSYTGGNGNFGVSEEHIKSMAIINNRMTQFNTLEMPNYLDFPMKPADRSTFKALSPIEQKSRLT
jgi:hypothetical protein